MSDDGASLNRQAARILDAVAAIGHAQEPDFTPLLDCQLLAETLRDEMEHTTGPHADAAGVVDGTHALGALYLLVRDGDSLDDERWQSLEASLKTGGTSLFRDDSFGRQLGTAIARGKLVLPGNDSVPASSASIFDDDPSGDEEVSEIPDDDGWVFDDFDDSAPSRNCSIIQKREDSVLAPMTDSVLCADSQLLRTPAESPSRIFKPTDADIAARQEDGSLPGRLSVHLYGDRCDEVLSFPRQQLRNGWRFSDMLLLEFYRERCELRRRFGYTPCCTDRFQDISAILGVPPRRLRFACRRLCRNGQIVIAANGHRDEKECRVWIKTGHLEGAGRRPVSPGGSLPVRRGEARHHGEAGGTLVPGLHDLID